MSEQVSFQRTEVSEMKKILIFAIPLLWLLPAQLSWAQLLVFGPQIYTRGPGDCKDILG